MIGPRQPSQKARRPPNLYIANPDSGSEDSNDERMSETRPPNTHPTLTLITQPPTPAVIETSSAGFGKQSADLVMVVPHPSSSKPQDVDQRSPGEHLSSHGFKDTMASDSGGPSSASTSKQSMPKLHGQSSSGSAGTASSGGAGSQNHEPPGTAVNSDTPRASSETSARSSTRLDRPLPTPSSPPSIPLPQPPFRHRMTGSSDSSITLPPPPSGYSSTSKREPPILSHHSSSSSAASPEVKRPLPQVDGAYSPIQPSPASSSSQPRPSFSIAHPLPNLPIHAGASAGAIRLGNVRLQVTTDNENFSVVDVSGVANGEAIMDRVFSKLRFRDDDHPTLSMYRTDIGEAHDPKAFPSNSLFSLCQSQGDSKGSLKFLVMQTALPQSTSSSAIPPPVLGNRSGQTIDYSDRPSSKRSRGTASVSSAGKQEKGVLRVMAPGQLGHSKDGSFSSVNEIMQGRPEYSSPTTGGETDGEGDFEGNGPSALSGKASLMRTTRMASNRRRLPSTASTSRSSKSPADDGVRNFAHLTSSPSPSFGILSSPSQSSATSTSGIQMVELSVPGQGIDGKRRGSVTPTMAAHPEHLQNSQAFGLPYLTDLPHDRILQTAGRNDPFMESPPLDMGGSSVQPQQTPASIGGDGETWLTSPSEPTEADLAVIAKLEEEERERDRRERIQLEEDRRVAMLEQQKEHEVWELIQAQEREARQRQVGTDRAAAELAVQQEQDKATQSRRDIERAERERVRQVGKERRERRILWENRPQVGAALDPSAPGWSRYNTGGGAEHEDLGSLATLATRQGSGREGISPTSPLDSRNFYEVVQPSGSAPSSSAYRQQVNQNRSPYNTPPPRFVPPAAPPPRERPLQRTETHPPPGAKGYSYEGRGLAINAVRVGPLPPAPADNRVYTGATYEPSRPRHPFAAARPPGPSDYNLNNARSMDNIRRSATTGLRESSSSRVDPLQPTVTPTYQYLEEQSRYPKNDSRQPNGGRSASRAGPSGARLQGSETSVRHGLHQLQHSEDVRDSYRSPPTSYSQTSGGSHRADNPSISMPVDFPQPMPYNVHSRRGSENAVTWSADDLSGMTGMRRASESSIVGMDGEGSIPRVVSVGGRLFEQDESARLVPPSAPSTRSSRSGTAGSATSSVISSETTRPPPLDRNRSQSEDDSGDTARAGDWAQTLGHMLRSSDNPAEDEGTYRPGFSKSQLSSPQLEDSPEETLWITPPAPEMKGTGFSATFSDSISSSGRPTLKLDTQVRPSTTLRSDSHPPSTDTGDIPSSTTDSEATEDMGARVQRHKSFAKNKDQWNFRPPAEHVYDNLQEFFPKIDLDKPVVHAVDPRLLLESVSPRTSSPDPLKDEPQAASRAPSGGRRAGFNKLESRKSIRVVAEGRKKHLSKIAPATKLQQTPLERKRSSSMWGHRVVEVTPSKLKSGQIPEAGGTANEAQTTMTWVKGDLIGKGTYGRVYLALNATTGDMIAVKQVEMPRTDRDREDARQAGMIDALKSEIALLKDLEHPNVVTYLGWEESPRFLSIFLEYVPGGSIASVYRRHNKFEEGVIKSFTRQILDGLAYLHSLHILHRDLKADNVLVDNNGICKISDFGISKRTNDAYDSIVSTNLKGSVFWMAPEVVHSVNGQGYSAKVDIWSLGCVVLEMWAGRRPWGDMEALAAMFQLANSRAAPPVPDDVILSPIASDFLNQQCFAPNPHDRPTAAELVTHRFITDVDPTWTFETSGIGRAVAAGIKR